MAVLFMSRIDGLFHLGKIPACESYFHPEFVHFTALEKSVMPHRLPNEAPDPVSFRGESDDFLGNDDQEARTGTLFNDPRKFRNF